MLSIKSKSEVSQTPLQNPLGGFLVLFSSSFRPQGEKSPTLGNPDYYYCVTWLEIENEIVKTKMG